MKKQKQTTIRSNKKWIHRLITLHLESVHSSSRLLIEPGNRTRRSTIKTKNTTIVYCVQSSQKSKLWRWSPPPPVRTWRGRRTQRNPTRDERIDRKLNGSVFVLLQVRDPHLPCCMRRIVLPDRGRCDAGERRSWRPSVVCAFRRRRDVRLAVGCVCGNGWRGAERCHVDGTCGRMERECRFVPGCVCVCVCVFFLLFLFRCAGFVRSYCCNGWASRFLWWRMEDGVFRKLVFNFWIVFFLNNLLNTSTY